MTRLKRGRVSLILTLFWWALIWIVSSIPSEDMPSLQILSVDKLAHMGVYFVLGYLMDIWLRGKQISPVRRGLIYLLILISAALDEYHQTFIPGRSVSFFDFLANAFGLLIAYGAGSLRRDQRHRT